MLKSKFMHAAIPAIVLLFAGITAAQIATFDLGAGVSFPTGKAYNAWDAGFDVCTNDFFWISDNVGIGGRGAINRWYTDKAHFNQTIWEIIPSIRYKTTIKDSPINFFGQGGFGLYIARAENSDGSQGAWIGRGGFSLGPGITLGLSKPWAIEVFPLYNIMFVGVQGNGTFYFTVNAAISASL